MLSSLLNTSTFCHCLIVVCNLSSRSVDQVDKLSAKSTLMTLISISLMTMMMTRGEVG